MTALTLSYIQLHLRATFSDSLEEMNISTRAVARILFSEGVTGYQKKGLLQKSTLSLNYALL